MSFCFAVIVFQYLVQHLAYPRYKIQILILPTTSSTSLNRAKPWGDSLTAGTFYLWPFIKTNPIQLSACVGWNTGRQIKRSPDITRLFNNWTDDVMPPSADVSPAQYRSSRQQHVTGTCTPTDDNLIKSQPAVPPLPPTSRVHDPDNTRTATLISRSRRGCLISWTSAQAGISIELKTSIRMVDELSKRLFPKRHWGEKFFQILRNVVLFIQTDGLENTGQTYSQD